MLAKSERLKDRRLFDLAFKIGKTKKLWRKSHKTSKDLSMLINDLLLDDN